MTEAAGGEEARCPRPSRKTWPSGCPTPSNGCSKQVETVEFWASAVTGLTAPVPDYDPEATKVARYLKPGRPARKRRRRRAANQNDKPDGAKPASA